MTTKRDDSRRDSTHDRDAPRRPREPTREDQALQGVNLGASGEPAESGRDSGRASGETRHEQRV